MVIENMRIERDGVVLPDSGTRHGPWITWRDTAGRVGDSVRLAVSYDVWLGGSRTIPLVHLTEPLARNGSPVTIAMRFAYDTGDVEFPHMTRQAPNQWSGRYVATPSYVKVGGFAFACDRNPPPGDDGGLVWRYWLLLGIMVAWVPISLVWARRTGEQA
jgi:hypothetical protein